MRLEPKPHPSTIALILYPLGAVAATLAIDAIRGFYRLDWPSPSALVITAAIVTVTVLISETVLGSRRWIRRRRANDTGSDRARPADARDLSFDPVADDKTSRR